MTNEVRLTVEQSNDDAAAICAMELLQYPNGWPRGGREVIIDREEASEFMDDCTGWDWVLHQYQDDDGQTVKLTATDRYHQGYSVVLTVDANNWERWREGYEVIEEPALEYTTAAVVG